MKNIVIKSLFAGFFFLFAFASCNESAKIEEESLGLNIKTFLPTRIDVGQKLAITGNKMDEVISVVFSGNITVTEIEHVGEFQINVIIPEGVIDGPIIVRTSDTEVVSRTNLIISVPELIQAYPREIKTGEVLTIKGKNLLSIEKIIFPDKVEVPSMNFNRKADDEILVKIPPKTIKGKGVVSLVSISGKEVDTLYLTIEVIDPGGDDFIIIDLWEGNKDLGDWGEDVKVLGSKFANVKPGSEITIEYSLSGSGQFKISATKDWVPFPETAQWDWGGRDLENGSTSYTFAITAVSLNKVLESEMVIQGKKAIVSKISAKVAKTQPILIWEGEEPFDLGSWSKNLMLSSENFKEVEAGWKINITYEQTGKYAQFKIMDGAWSPLSIVTGSQINLPEGETLFSFEFKQKDIDKILSTNGFYIQGQNAKLFKIMAVPQ